MFLYNPWEEKLSWQIFFYCPPSIQIQICANYLLYQGSHFSKKVEEKCFYLLITGPTNEKNTLHLFHHDNGYITGLNNFKN